MKKFYKTCLVSGLMFGQCIAVGSVWAATGGKEAPDPVNDPLRPNILWISCEDLSPQIGAYEDPFPKTPIIDRLAQEGMLFERAYTTAGVCAPSRSGIITGMYQTSTRKVRRWSQSLQ